MQSVGGRYRQRMKGHHDALSPLRALEKASSTLGSTWNANPLRTPSACLYIHVPFCSKRCHFCSMRRQVGPPSPEYLETLRRQMRQFEQLDGVSTMRFEAVYFGGGTPTVLSPSSLAAVIRGLKTSFAIEAGAEITVESSVSDLTDEHLAVLAAEGVNRISLGVQTFSDRGRKILGRRGSGEDTALRIEHILQHGFANVSLDVIYNYPGQSLAELQQDLDQITILDIAGISFYPLMLHDGAVLNKRLQSGQLAPPLDTAGEMTFFQTIYEHLSRHDFEVLELTKMVRPGRDRYQYIRTRYGGGSTLAFGPGAAGKLGAFAYHNPLDMDAYRERVDQPLTDLPGLQKSSFEENVYKMIGFIQMGWFPDEHVWPQAEAWLAPLRQALLAEHLLQEEPAGFALSAEGLFWGNSIAHELAEDAAAHYKARSG